MSVCICRPKGDVPGHKYIYKPFVDVLNLCLPLSIFEINILRLMNVAPNHKKKKKASPIQLHPNGRDFVRGFEILCRVLEISPTPSLFFSFHRTKGVEKGIWVSVHGILHRGTFLPFCNFKKHWKDKFFRVRPKDDVSGMFADAEGKYKLPR